MNQEIHFPAPLNIMLESGTELLEHCNILLEKGKVVAVRCPLADCGTCSFNIACNIASDKAYVYEFARRNAELTNYIKSAYPEYLI